MNNIALQDDVMIKSLERQFLKCCTEIINNNHQNEPIINAVLKTIKKWNFVKKIINKSVENQTSYFKTLKQSKKSSCLTHKSTFYSFLIKIRNIWLLIKDKKYWTLNNSFFKQIINNVPLPTNPNRKYDIKLEKTIGDLYFHQHKQHFLFNKTNIWKQSQTFFPKISLKTICKYIKRHPAYIEDKKRTKIKHSLRKWDLDIGNIQLDVKVIGKKDNSFKRKLYILDAKDQQSKLYCCKLLKTQTKQEILNGLIEIIDFYHQHKIKIKNLRTDNAMVFKHTNWVQTSEFNNILKQYNINHEFIPLGQPECNGVIERQHRILDEEFIKHNILIKNFKEYECRLKEYQNYFNTNRFHKYSFMNNKNNFYTPMQFLTKYYFNKLNAC